MAKAEVKFDGDPSNVIAALQKIISKQEEVSRSIGHMSSQSRRGAKEAQDAFTKLGDSLTKTFTTGLVGTISGIAGGILSIATAAAQVRREIEQIQRLQKEAAEAQITLSSARKDLIRNMPGASPKEVDAMLKAGQTIAEKTKVDEKYIDKALATAMSASGQRKAESIQAAEIAAKYLPDKPGDIPRYAGSLMDLSDITKSNDPLVNQGLMSWIAGNSRVTDPEQQARNIPSALKGAVTQGATAAEAGALFAALTTSAKDFEGAASGTAEIGLATQLREFESGPLKDKDILKNLSAEMKGAKGKKLDTLVSAFRDKNLSDAEIVNELNKTEFKGRIGELRQRRTEGLPKGMTTGQQIDYLQQNPTLAQKFLDQASFEKKFTGPIKELLTDPNSQISKDFKAYRQQMPDQKGLAAEGQKMMDNFNVDPTEKVAKTARAYESFSQQMKTKDPNQALGAVHREGLKKALESMGEGDLAGKISSGMFEIKSGIGTVNPDQVGEDILTKRRNELLKKEVTVMRPDAMLQPMGPGMIQQPITQTIPKSESEMKHDTDLAAKLDILINEIRGLRSDTKGNKPKEPGALGVTPGEDK